MRCSPRFETRAHCLLRNVIGYPNELQINHELNPTTSRDLDGELFLWTPPRFGLDVVILNRDLDVGISTGHRGNTFLWRHSGWSAVIAIRLPCILGEFDETMGCESRVLRGFNAENVLYIHINLVLLWLRLCSLNESSKFKLGSWWITAQGTHFVWSNMRCHWRMKMTLPSKELSKTTMRSREKYTICTGWIQSNICVFNMIEVC